MRLMAGSINFINDSMIQNSSFINEIWLVAEPSEIIIKLVIFVPTVLWGIFWNAVLIGVIAKHKVLWTPTNLLIGNTAVADLLSLSIHPWVFLLYNFYQNYPLGAVGCKVEGAFECQLLLASVMSLSALSYDRLTAIVAPQETRLTVKRTKIVIALAWIIGGVLALPLFFCRLYKERKWLDFTEKYCTEDTFIVNIYWHVIITMLVWVPLGIMSVCYILLFIKLSRYEKKIKSTNAAIKVKYKAKVAKTMFIIILTFIICRLPFTAQIFYRNQLLKSHVMGYSHEVRNTVNGTYQALWFSSKYLMILNAAINPLVYGLSNEKFRKVLKKTPIIGWMFQNTQPSTSAAQKSTDEKKKITKESLLIDSNRNKIFNIFMARSPFVREKQAGAVVGLSISDRHDCH